MLRDDFIGLVSLSLSLFPFIIYLRQQNDKSRYASCVTPARVQSPSSLFSRKCCNIPAREKRLSFHGNAVTLWHLSTLSSCRRLRRLQNTLSALYCDANANRARDIYIFLTFSYVFIFIYSWNERVRVEWMYNKVDARR